MLTQNPNTRIGLSFIGRKEVLFLMSLLLVPAFTSLAATSTIIAKLPASEKVEPVLSFGFDASHPIASHRQNQRYIFVAYTAIVGSGNQRHAIKLGRYDLVSKKWQISRLDSRHFMRPLLPNGRPDGHHRTCIGLDQRGFIHVVADMHHYPWGNATNHLAPAFKNKKILYWRSTRPWDITSMKFEGGNSATSPPGAGFTYPNMFNDKNGQLYIHSRVWVYGRDGDNKPGKYGLMLARYDAGAKKWRPYGANPNLNIIRNQGINVRPLANGRTTPVVFWQPNGVGGTAYQAYKAHFTPAYNSAGYIHMAVAVNHNNTDGPGAFDATRVVYAHSRDGGNNWRKSNGAWIGKLMNASNTTVIASTPQITWTASVAVDKTDNSPIVAWGEKDKGYWRQWHVGNRFWKGKALRPLQDSSLKRIFTDWTGRIYVPRVWQIWDGANWNQGNSVHNTSVAFNSQWDDEHTRSTNKARYYFGVNGTNSAAIARLNP